MGHSPSLYQINTRVWLAEVSRRIGRRATLDDVPDQALDWMVGMGFDWVWLLSVWQTGEASRRVSHTHPEWRHEFEATLTDLCDDDITGSGFAITSYTVHRDLGGDIALARLRERLARRGLRLMLDFVPNHTALDHPWIHEHPEYFVCGTELELSRAPRNYTWVRRSCGDLVFAHGRDPFFDGWPDTLQLNYGMPATLAAMTGELLRIAGQCDGVRCDMAMLLLPDVFERTWGIPAAPFWPETMRTVRGRYPDFRFMAEVYWDLEWALQQQGFDYTYDKRLYDRLHAGSARAVREHLRADLAYQEKSARFLENHDEPRAAAAFAPGMNEAAAIVTYLVPGLRFFHQGQFTGRRMRISPHLCRAPVEPVDDQARQFYQRLLALLRRAVVRDGEWRLLEAVPAWEGNGTWDAYLAFAWQGVQRVLLTVVNYAPHRSQCYLPLPFPDLAGHQWRLSDMMSDAAYDRNGTELAERGLYLDLGPWQYHVFDLQPADPLEPERRAMKGITIEPNVPGTARFEEVPEPSERDGSVLVEAIAVGVCGTDVEMVEGKYGWAPPGKTRLVLGHESLGRVLDPGPNSAFQKGDLVVGIVRRPDPVPCPNCAVGEWDMCRNGQYTERGIKQIDGFMSERWRVEPEYAVRIDQSLGLLGVLLEPMSVVAKAWEQVARVGQRAFWEPRTALITGAGPIGLLAALIGVQRGLEVHVMDRMDSGPKPDLVRALGATYHAGSVASTGLEPDVLVECTGVGQVIAESIKAVGAGGVVCLTGVGSGGHTMGLTTADVAAEMVLGNNVVVGTVNANKRHWYRAADALVRADRSWLERLINRRERPENFAKALHRQPDDIKVVIQFAQA